MNTIAEWIVITVQWCLECHGPGRAEMITSNYYTPDRLIFNKASKADLAFLRDLCNRVLIKLKSKGRVGVGVHCLVYVEPKYTLPNGLRQPAA